MTIHQILALIGSLLMVFGIIAVLIMTLGFIRAPLLLLLIAGFIAIVGDTKKIF